MCVFCRRLETSGLVFADRKTCCLFAHKAAACVLNCFSECERTFSELFTCDQVTHTHTHTPHACAGVCVCVCVCACVCVCVLPAVRPAPAGAAAAGSPAASAPPPAVYGYTPNQSAPRSARDAANQRAPRQAGSKSEPRQPVTSAEQEIEDKGRGGQRSRFTEEV